MTKRALILFYACYEKVYIWWHELQQITKVDMIRTKYMLLLETRHIAWCPRLICDTAIVRKVEALPKPMHHPIVIMRKVLSSATRNTTTQVCSVYQTFSL